MFDYCQNGLGGELEQNLLLSILTPSSGQTVPPSNVQSTSRQNPIY